MQFFPRAKIAIEVSGNVIIFGKRIGILSPDLSSQRFFIHLEEFQLRLGIRCEENFVFNARFLIFS